MIDSVGTNSHASAQGAAAGLDRSMGKEDFLKLMVAQMRNQDPLNPQDPTAFTEQLATFSSLEQSLNMNETLKELLAQNAAGASVSQLNLLGTQVVSDAGTLRLSGEAVELGVELPRSVDSVQVSVLDAAGKSVATLTGLPTSAGRHLLAWDGTDASGAALPPGDYRLLASAKVGDAPVDVTAITRSIVTAVAMDQSDYVLTSTGAVPLSSLREAAL